MAKSIRSKREKRLRAARREIVEPFYENKDAAKLAAQEAALAAPKLPMRSTVATVACSSSMDMPTISTNMDVEMADGNQTTGSLKPAGRIKKKSTRKFKVGKGKRHGVKAKSEGNTFKQDVPGLYFFLLLPASIFSCKFKV